MAKLSYSYNSIIDTPLPADQTLREMFTILETLKYAIDNNPRVTSYSAECTLYDHYKQMIADGLKQLRSDADQRISYSIPKESAADVHKARNVEDAA
jgi:hypothetical protein